MATSIGASDFEPVWELRPGLPWRGLILSIVLHGLGFGPLFVHSVGPAQPDDSRAALQRSIPLFVPKPVLAEAVQARIQQPDSLRASPQLRLPEPGPAPPSQEVRVDMNSIQLSFADDVTNQLPGVVERNRGMLALIDKEDPAIARYVIEPPDWIVRETLLDVSRKVCFAMYPPQKWRLLQSVARSSGLRLDRYQVCALFESPYNQCLQEAIRSKAAAVSGGGKVRVQSARLAFEGGSHCGVAVLEVSFAPASVREP
jgi:hypothetical protein